MIVKKLLIFIVEITTLLSTNAENILVVAPHPVSGQWIYFEQFIKELLHRGHTVSGVTSYNLRQNHSNFTGYILPVLNVEKLCKMI
jgi:hypothetical protein